MRFRLIFHNSESFAGGMSFFGPMIYDIHGVQRRGNYNDGENKLTRSKEERKDRTKKKNILLRVQSKKKRR